MTSSLSQRIEQLFSDGFTETDAVELIMKGSTAAERKAWAREYVLAVATAVARTQARQVEHHAARTAQPPQPRRSPPAQPDDNWWMRYSVPSAWVEDGKYHYRLNGEERQDFRRSMGEDAFGTWYTKVHEALVHAGASQHEFDSFESDWCPDGPQAYWRMRDAERVCALVREVAARTRLEVTAELLATDIKLGDGTTVTWGDATAQQLRQRAEMVIGMAAGDIQSAATLTVAADMLDQAGVTCLNELRSQAA
jgi:hypothetical protein